MGYFMDQGLSDLKHNILLAAADAKDGKAKKCDMIRKTDSLEKTLFRPGYPLI
jgi:hypothetical protein